jgi:hypothetical protein
MVAHAGYIYIALILSSLSNLIAVCRFQPRHRCYSYIPANCQVTRLATSKLSSVKSLSKPQEVVTTVNSDRTHVKPGQKEVKRVICGVNFKVKMNVFIIKHSLYVQELFFASDSTRKIQDSRAGYSGGHGLEVNLNARRVTELDSIFRAHADSAAVESAELAVAIRLDDVLTKDHGGVEPLARQLDVGLCADALVLHRHCIHVSFF